jgi:hypothetical protein
MKVARSALSIPLAPWERAGVRETVMAAASYILWAGADAMIVRRKRATIAPRMKAQDLPRVLSPPVSNSTKR